MVNLDNNWAGLNNPTEIQDREDKIELSLRDLLLSELITTVKKRLDQLEEEEEEEDYDHENDDTDSEDSSNDDTDEVEADDESETSDCSSDSGVGASD